MSLEKEGTALQIFQDAGRLLCAKIAIVWPFVCFAQVEFVLYLSCVQYVVLGESDASEPWYRVLQDKLAVYF